MDKVGSSAEKGARPPGSEQEVTTRLGRGRRLGRYRLLELIRKGKRTELYRAESAGRDGLPALYAVKIARAELDTSLDAARELSNEIQILSQLDHPNVVRLEDHGNVAGAIYLALEYLEGRSVSQLLQALAVARSWMPADVATHVALEIALGLAHVHRAAVGSVAPSELVHRDVRPGHLMLLRTGAVKLIDFGAARCADRRAGRHITDLDVRQGTISYMAPEQVLGQPVDRRADLFSLGVVLWEMLAQRRLFLRETPQETASAIVEAPIPKLSSLRSDVSPALESSVDRALARDPMQRYQNADDMAADLGRSSPGRELMTRGVAVLIEATMDGGDSGLLPLPPRSPPAAAPRITIPPPRPPPLPPASAAERTAVSWRPLRGMLDNFREERKRVRLLRAAALALLGFAGGALWQRRRDDQAEARRAAKVRSNSKPHTGVTIDPIKPIKAPAATPRPPRRRSRAR